ncbi:MAG: magnesium transporter [Thermoleophilaceae bacterium]|nr:magnesium transporter [Thermoleophilaceae bacterium]
MIVDCAVYDDGKRTKQIKDLGEAYRLGSSGDGRFVWIGLHDPTPDEFDSVAREFELHELAAEDATKPHQRPKLEVYGHTIFIVMKTVHYEEENDAVETGQVMIFVGPGFVITVRHGPYADLHPVREWVEERPELLRCGPGAVVHAVIDRVVDEYEPVTTAVDEDIEEVEDEVFSPQRTQPTERIYGLQREVLEMHRAVAPLVEPLRRLARAEFDFVHEDLSAYFGDVYDHILRYNERIESFRELLHGILDANLAQVSVRQNDDMRKISAWVAIIAVPTMFAGIYGMNFDHMPELHWRYGYPAVLLVIAISCVSLYRYFKKVGWL